jgi:hypothetical protein
MVGEGRPGAAPRSCCAGRWSKRGRSRGLGADHARRRNWLRGAVASSECPHA